ncbi:mRNA cleavage and polyadenylation specificity factor complex subunit Ysh1 [Saitoella complicata NRRL Y-17804]|uniref:Endoribonuclease YSH1 n=1 Tax=Saitoella complicata (strain BCRC 22490 / CBS 7301 / JCM 7358 / NBRC 10748 / NRRL Y-17804) TaxID=698492 RepID=A0A0E9NPX7_SAICN|nr:mRNA cleavage and polyadenylation specificity factor complex subunit Ysh1 [Saitoella complicata NRRL Y-17804]ODQ51880.1 mRNA cleavage and polyadenylation specificity factor complex subunit Ysh1 [Saitoella complicata NRRL Y-17804]GAO51751.1 hypothetical protein G7K_5844-t1 [Saitoella complicata NRRL Y-17804]
MSKRKAETVEIPVDPSDVLEFTNLGAGNEVGRSCHIIQFKGKTVMLDAGVHPAYTGLAALPFYDEFDLSTVDVLLISHFHLDHAASLPYVMQKTNFRGRVFMTHPTKAIYKWLLSDFVRVSNVGPDDQLYEEKDLLASYEKIETIDYHSTVIVDGIKITPYHAGHVLGAAMFFIEIAGVKILFTGDYSREEDRHLNVAEVPPEKPDIMITESTYGTAAHQPREEKENRLTHLIHSTLRRGGRALLPVFALGRAQELLLILEEYWTNHPELHSVPIYYASSLARKCMAVYQTYINMMNDNIRRKFREGQEKGEGRNPFIFKHIQSLRSLERFEDVGPCVMLASPGMLQNGVSRELLERWCPDPRNSLLVTGYSVEGTMAKHILNEPPEIQSLSGQALPRRMQVEELSFAAHVDGRQNQEFIHAIGARHIILVHGEQNNMGRLKSNLMSHYKGNDQVKIYNPRNCEPLQLPFRSDKIAKTIGSLATKPPANGVILSGVLVQKDFGMSVMAAEDLREFSGLVTSIVVEKQRVRFGAGVSLLVFHLEQMFGAVRKELDEEKRPMFKVMDTVTIRCVEEYELEIEWVGNVMNDSIADAVLAILLGVESSPASVKLTNQSCSHSHYPSHANVTPALRLERVLMFLEAQFGEWLTSTDVGCNIVVDDHKASVNLETLEVECGFEPLRSRIKAVLERAVGTVAPFARFEEESDRDDEEVKEEDEDTR